MGCGASTPIPSDAHYDFDISKHGAECPDDVKFARAVALEPAPAVPSSE